MADREKFLSTKMEDQEENLQVVQFMNSPLITWFSNCVENITPHKVTFDDVVDGVYVYNVFLQMDIHGHINDVAPPKGNDEQRLKNLQVIMANIRLFYEEDSVVLQEPEIRLIARAAHRNIREVELLLVLLLGCAVKCPNKRIFIERIQALDDETKKGIKSHVEKITEYPEVVLCRDMLLIEEVTDEDELEYTYQSSHTKKVYKAFEQIRRINKERIELIEREDSMPPAKLPHCIMELNEWKAKALQLKNIEEEYTQLLTECTQKLEICEKDKSRFASEAKAAKQYRDELDAAMEKALKADRLEQEVARYKLKLEQHESCKVRLEELKQDNKLLNENKEELVVQVNGYKARIDKVLMIEEKMYKLQEEYEQLVLENDASKQKIAELTSINEELERQVELAKPALQSSFIASSSESLNTSFDISIKDQLSRSTNTQLLKLELENNRLSKLVESFREKSFHEGSFKIIDLKKEAKRLELTNEELKWKINQFEEQLTAVNKEKLQLEALLEKAQKVDNSETESRIISLECEKREALRELERTQLTLNDKIISLDTSSKIIKELQMKLHKLEWQRKREQEDSNDELNSYVIEGSPKQTILYNRLNSDFESVLHEKKILMIQLRETQLKLKRQDEIIKQLESTIKCLQEPGSPDAINKEHLKLKQRYAHLMFDYRKTRSALNELMKNQNKNEQEIKNMNLKILDLELMNSSLRDKCMMLTKENDTTDSEKKKFMEYISQLLKHNRVLVTQLREDKDRYNEELNKNNEAVKHLYGTKGRLEEKIIDLFQQMNNAQKVKKKNPTLLAVKKTISMVSKASSEFFARSKKSWSDGNSKHTSATEKSNEFEFLRVSDAASIANSPSKSDENPSATNKSNDFESTKPSDVTALDNAPKNKKSVNFFITLKPKEFTIEAEK